jgi:D-lactate dehydrogenase (cytochrome)
MSAPFVCRPPRGDITNPRPLAAEDVRPYLEDAAHYAGGHAARVFAPSSEADLAGILKRSDRVLAVGAQSSLTGGATPFGETLVSMLRMNRVLEFANNAVRVEPGLTLTALDAALAVEGRWYPPAPTFHGATVGGIVATNAAGAATFKYGSTRQWIRALSVMLANGDVLDIARGDQVAAEGDIVIQTVGGDILHVPVPRYRMPDVAKLSAGYYAAPAMDVVDLFIGSEGTLGIVTEVTLSVAPVRRPLCLALTTFASIEQAWSSMAELRRLSLHTRASADPTGLDVSAIEYMDRRSLRLLRDDGLDVREGVLLPPDSAIAVLVTIELAPGTTAADVYRDVAAAADAAAPPAAMTSFARILDSFAALDRTRIAAPGDAAGTARLLRMREAVPMLVNGAVAIAKQRDRRVEKTAADIIVAFEQVASLERFCAGVFERGQLDGAVWGHLSDGNLHPNVIPRDYSDVERGREAMLEIGREAMRLGGAPLAEHGVGRNRIKQQLLLDLYGEAGIGQMRAVKKALDPRGKLAPGVLFGS